MRAFVFLNAFICVCLYICKRNELENLTPQMKIERSADCYILNDVEIKWMMQKKILTMDLLSVAENTHNDIM